MIQDIGPHRFDNTFRRKVPEGNDVVVVVHGGKILLEEGGEQHNLPRYAMLQPHCPPLADKLVYLFSVDEHAFYLFPENIEAPPGYSFQDFQIFRTYQPSWMAFAGVTASHLALWHAKNRYCGTCGARMGYKPDERALLCPACGATVYPTISPAIIVGVVDGDRLLMTRYANRPYRRMALVAGFMEIGETLEDTVRREVMEEVGVRVKNIRYYKSQPWAFSGSVLVGFYADLDGSPEITIDRKELQEAEWIARENIPPTDTTISLTSEMVEMFRHGTYPR